MTWNIFKKIKQDKEQESKNIAVRKKFLEKDRQNLLKAGFTEEQVTMIRKSIINHIILMT